MGNYKLWRNGGNSRDPIVDVSSPWAAAIYRRLEVVRDRIAKEEAKGRDGQDDYCLRDDIGFRRGLYSMEAMLGGYKHPRAAVFRAYRATEDFFAVVYRYDDEFAKAYEDLSRSIADVQGALYSIMARDEVYAKAYVAHWMLEDLIGLSSKHGDTVWEVAYDSNAFHNLNHIVDLDFKELLALDSQRHREPFGLNERVCLLADILGHVGSHPGLATGLANALRAKGIKVDKDFDAIKRQIEARLEAESRDFELREERKRKLSAVAIHGSQALDWWREEE